jgi:hypothetical protein
MSTPGGRMLTAPMYELCRRIPVLHCLVLFGPRRENRGLGFLRGRRGSHTGEGCVEYPEEPAGIEIETLWAELLSGGSPPRR